MTREKFTNKSISTGLWLFIILVIFVFMILILKGYRLGINRSKSEPTGIYLLSPVFNRTFELGEMVAFEAPKHKWIDERKYMNGQKLVLKIIGAKSGNWLFTKDKIIFSCVANRLTDNCKKLGKCLARDTKGRKVYCYSWNSYKVPDGWYYLQSDYIDTSLDSRYFGLVKKNNIKYRAARISLWP